MKHFVTPEHIRSAPDLCQAAVRFDLRLTDGRQRIKLAELKRIIRERREKAAGKRAKTKRK